MEGRIISAFPGTGKTHYSKLNKSAIDCDSSSFKKDFNFPRNYIQHMHNFLFGPGIVFISSHKEVRDALFFKGYGFELVYPKRECKEEYLQRYYNRGSEPIFIRLMEEKWDLFIDDMEAESRSCHVEVHVLGPEQFLSDVITTR